MSKNKKGPVEIDLTTADETRPEADPEGAAPAPAAEPPAPPSGEERIASLEAEKAEIKDRMLRIAADFDNWKKRARKDQSDGEMRAKESVLRDFLEIADNLERATASWVESKDSDAKSIRDGVELVLRQFRSKLERYQVKPIESLGLPFDPRFHEAVSQAPSAETKPGSVLHELQKGYLIGERLLRPAMVVVAAAAPTPAPEKPVETDVAPDKPAAGNPEGED
jgi:Molecular chaperone GrpE (heat shock protein)